MSAADYLRRIQAVPFRACDDMNWIAETLALYVQMIEARVHFAQAAYRDGEFAWILGDGATINANGEVGGRDLGDQLAETLLRPVGQWCLYFSGKREPLRPKADAWLREHRPPVEWIPDRPLARANEQGMLAPFWEAVRGRSVCVVGPAHLGMLPAALLNPQERIVVPNDGTAWKRADELARAVEASPCDLFLIAAGSAANLVIHRAWPRVQHRATLIDIGATLDPYAGVYSRNLYRTPEWQRSVMPKNWPGGERAA